MKAVILAAGEGTRLRPLTKTRPKPMLPVGNKPLLEHVLEAAHGAGIEEFVFVVGYKRERIQSYFGDGDHWGVDIEYVVQETQLGTGHALLQAEHAVDDAFLVLNGDRMVAPDAISMVYEERRGTESPVLAVTRHQNPEQYGVVELDGQSVTSIREKPPAHTVQTDYINAGIYGFGPAVFDTLRDVDTDGELGITALFEENRADPQAVHIDGLWLDVSYLWDLLEVNSRILDRDQDDSTPPATTTIHDAATVSDITALGSDVRVRPNATLLPGTTLGDNVEIGANAVVANSIVLADARIGDGAVVRDCIVGENADIGVNTTIAGGITAVAVDRTVHEDVRLGGVVGDNAMVGSGVIVAAGAILGTGTTVETGATVSGQIETDAIVRRG
jgi:glucose-1-phosphate thymidylyltransferase